MQSFLKVHGEFVNIKDIHQISKLPNDGGVSFDFLDGDSILARRSSVSFFHCESAGSCQNQKLVKTNKNLPLFMINNPILNSNLKIDYEIKTTTSLDSLLDSFKELKIIVRRGDDYSAFINKIENIRKFGNRTVNDKYSLKGSQKSDDAILAEALNLRQNMRIGSLTNCGPVYEVRESMVGVQTKHGKQFIRIDNLFGPLASCHFDGKKYIGK